MPKQSRGFWVCIHCDRFFDRHPEALYHEQYLCPRRRFMGAQPVAIDQPPSPPQHRMAPYDPVAPPQMQVGMPSARPPDATTATAPSGYDSKPAAQKYLPILGSQDQNPFRSTVDTMVCRAMEFFEVSDVPQVGIRCVACVETPLSYQSYVFPQNTRSVGLSLRQASLAHLKQCRSYPEEYRQMLRREPEPDDLNELTDFCMTRCHVVGIVDRPSGGLIFSGTRLPPPPPPVPLPQQPSQYYPLPPPTPTREDPSNDPYFVPEVPAEYPFVFVDNRQWICKYCAHIHPDYRERQSCWANIAPPPSRFIDYHLSVCREFQRGYSAPQPPPQPPAAYQPRGGYGWGERPPPPAAPMPEPKPLSPAFPPSYEPPPSNPAPAGDVEVRQAIDYLEANDRSKVDMDGNPINESDILVLPDDRLLLTEYFFYLMKQLRPVRFSESDRRTRGGKREKVQIGYGGLQCVHCVDIPQARKFFWSNVDRLANSFAEIPGHIFRCKRCPEATKNALRLLKQRHPDQMSRLPRGSQKVFFRRMWRRLHEPDAALAAPAQPPTPQPEPSPANSSGSDESQYFLRRPAIEAAKVLVDGSVQEGPPSPQSRVLLAIPEDRHWVSDTDCFIRRQLEVFCATADDVATAADDHKYPVQVGQVGIRCLHCALSPQGAKGPAVAFPFTISGIYEAAKEFQRVHLDNCVNLPLSAKAKFESLKGSSSLSSMLRKHYVQAARAIGLKDTEEGIRAGGTPVPVAFSFDDDEPSSSRKRKVKREEDDDDEPRKKRAMV